MDLPTLLTSRDTAGARYAKAVAEMRDALIALGGIDEALENRRVALRTFFHLPQNLGTLAHPTFAPANTAVDWVDEIHARRDSILATFRRRHYETS